MASATNPMMQNEDLGKKVQETGSALGAKARNLAENALDKAKETASSFGDKAEHATQAVGTGIESLGGSLRDKMPQKGVLGAATDRVASGLEAGGKFIQEEGLKGMADDVTNLVRRNPIPALLVAASLGYMLGRITMRS